MSAQYGAYRYALTAGTTTSGGDVLSLANPEGQTLLVTRLVVYTSTKPTGAANMDAGIAATATTSSDTLIDGCDIGTAAGVFDNIKNGGSNGKACQTWGASEFLTITPSASAAGLVGFAYVEYLRTSSES